MSRVPSPEVESQNSDEQIPVNTVAISPFLPEQRIQMLPLEERLLASAATASKSATKNDAKPTSFYNIQQQANTTQSARILTSQDSYRAIVVTKGIIS